MLVLTLIPTTTFAQDPCADGQNPDYSGTFNGFFPGNGNGNDNGLIVLTVGETTTFCLEKKSPTSFFRSLSITNIQSNEAILGTFDAYTPAGDVFNQVLLTATPPTPVPLLQGQYGFRFTPTAEGSLDVTTTVQTGRSAPRTSTITVQIVAASVAPVTWTRDLTYTPFGENIRFDWSVADQVDVSGYELERMYANGAFTKVADIAYRENGSLEVNYSVDTPWPGQGAYYRVKQLDFAGTYDYSNVVFVEGNDGIQQAFGMFPNPASDWVRLSVPADVKTVDLISASGQTIRSLTADEARRGLDVSAVRAGLYLVRPVMEDGPAAPQRLMVNH